MDFPCFSESLVLCQFIRQPYNTGPKSCGPLYIFRRPVETVFRIGRLEGLCKIPQIALYNFGRLLDCLLKHFFRSPRILSKGFKCLCHTCPPIFLILQISAFDTACRNTFYKELLTSDKNNHYRNQRTYRRCHNQRIVCCILGNKHTNTQLNGFQFRAV